MKATVTVEKRRDIVGLKLLVVAEARILEGVEAGVGEDSRLVDSDGRAHHTRRRAGRVEAKLLHFRAFLDSQRFSHIHKHFYRFFKIVLNSPGCS